MTGDWLIFQVELPPYPESESEASHVEPQDIRFHALFVRKSLTAQELGTESVFILCFFGNYIPLSLSVSILLSFLFYLSLSHSS